MDRVFIEGLEVDTVIGAYDWERGIRQCLRLDLSFAWDNRPAAAGDEYCLFGNLHGGKGREVGESA